MSPLILASVSANALRNGARHPHTRSATSLQSANRPMHPSGGAMACRRRRCSQRPARPRGAPYVTTARCRGPSRQIRKILHARLAAHAVRAAGSTCSTRRRSISRSRTSRTGSRASRAGTDRPPARIFSRSRSTRCWSTRSRGGARSLDTRARLAILLHDAPEYVIGDMITPFKAVIGDAYKAVESRLLAAIHLRFGLPRALPAELTRLIKDGRPRLGLSGGDAACGIWRNRGEALLRHAARGFGRVRKGLSDALAREGRAKRAI